MNQGINSSANSSVGASSLTTGTKSGLSGGSNLQRNMSMNTDSLTSSGAASVGLPASPLSFSSSNVSMPGSSGLVSPSLAQQGGSTLTSLDSQQDLTAQLQQPNPSSSLSSQQLQSAHQAAQVQQEQQKFDIKQEIMQPFDEQTLINNEHPSGQSTAGLNGNQLVAPSANDPMQGSGLIGAKQVLQNTEQLLAHLQASLPAAKLKHDGMLQQHLVQNILQKPDLLSAHLLRQESLQRQQSQQIQAQLSISQQQRLLQHQQMLQSLPPHLQRSHLQQQQQQLQQHLQHQAVGIPKQPTVESGACARRLMQYMQHQRSRPADNDISFWRKFVAEYFAPHAKKRWCFSEYLFGGRQPTGVFPQDVWRCEICGSNPGRGFEATVEVLPRLCKIKYDSGELEELLFVDGPREYKLSSGLMVLDYRKAIQESVFECLRVIRDGQLRIIFTPDLKILSWGFCAKNHEELLPRKTVISQVHQLALIASKYQTAVGQNGGAALSSQELQSICNMFVASSRQLVKNLEASPVNEIGFTKRYVRSLQISEVVNSMKDLIDFSGENNLGPIESLIKFPRHTASSIVSHPLQQQQDHAGPSFVPEQNVTKLTPMELDVDNNINNSFNRQVSGQANPLTSFQSLLRQNSNSLQSVIQNDPCCSFPSVVRTLSGGGSLSNSLQASPTSSLTSFQTTLSSMSATPQPSSLNNLPNTMHHNAANARLLQQASLQSLQLNQQNTEHGLHHLFQDMMNPQLNGNGTFQQGLGACNAGNGVNNGLGNGMGNAVSSLPGSLGANNGITWSSMGTMGNGLRNTVGGLGGMSGNLGGNGVNMANCLRNMGSNVPTMASMGSMNSLRSRLNLAAMSQQSLHLQDGTSSHQHDLSANGILSGLGTAGDFGNLPLNWKP